MKHLTSISIWVLFLLVVWLMLPACSNSFQKGVKSLKRGKTTKAEKSFEKHLKDPIYDLAAQYYLLRLHTKSARSLREWARADSLSGALASAYDTISPDKAAKLKKVKAGRRNVESYRVRFQRKAIQYAEQNGTVPMLDTIALLFPKWDKRVLEDWDSARARVVNRNLPTKDYDIATSVLNRHEDVVYPANYPHIWSARSNIWDLFMVRYTLCDLDRFQRDHPLHYISADCWIEEARLAFCEGSLDTVLAFLRRRPGSGLEFLAIPYIIDQHVGTSTADMEPELRTYLADLVDFAELIEQAACRLSEDRLSQDDLYRYLEHYAPRKSAFALLQQASAHYIRHNRHREALVLLSDMKPLFPDSLVCFVPYLFQVKKQEWLSRAITSLEQENGDLHAGPALHWKTSGSQVYSAVSYDEGREVYYTMRKEKRSRLMRSVWTEEEQWSFPQEVPAFNFKGQTVTPLSMTDDGLEMLLKIGRYLHLSKRPSLTAAWGAPQKLQVRFPNMKRAVLAPDGSAIIADATASKPTADGRPTYNLFWSERDANGVFQKRKPLLGSVNTDRQEINPYLSADGRTLYFCSDRRDGFGKLDVYMTRRNGDGWTDWSEPINLGYRINTADDDYGFTWAPADGKAALFTSINLCNEDRDVWRTDIPTFARPEPVTLLRGLVTNHKGLPLSTGRVEVTFDDASEIYTTPINSLGQYKIKIPPGAHTAYVYANVPGFYTPRDTLHLVEGVAAGSVIRDTFALLPMRVIQEGLELPALVFKEMSAQFAGVPSQQQLKLLAAFAWRRKVNLTLQVHTDQSLPGAKSMELSQARADAILQYMRDTLGLPAKKIMVEGKGAATLKCPGNTPADHLCNNRVVMYFEVPAVALKVADASSTSDQAVEPGRSVVPVDKPKSMSPALSPGNRKSKKNAEEVVSAWDDEDEKNAPKREKWWNKLVFWKKKKKETKKEEQEDPELETDDL